MKPLLGCIGILLLAITASAAPEGLVGEWNFDEGTGTVAGDSSGNGHDAKLHGAGWVAQGEGFALLVDDGGEHAACNNVTAALFEAGPVSIEAWVKPTVKGHGEAHLIGQGMSSFVLTWYNAELCYWYIGSGGNNLRGKLTLHGWNHVVGAYDGANMTMWINGRQVGSKKSKEPGYKPGDAFHIGSSGGSDGPRFEGALDSVRLYNRAVSAEEAVAHFKVARRSFACPARTCLQATMSSASRCLTGQRTFPWKNSRSPSRRKGRPCPPPPIRWWIRSRSHRILRHSP
jgi:hypothetical protein